MRILWRNDDHPLGSHAEWIEQIDSKNRQPGTSAPTLAAAWSGLVDVHAALSGQPALEGFVIDDLIVEAQANVDGYSGGRRNHDVVLRGHTATGERTVVCIEAKAGESLGDTISGQIASAKKAELKNDRSNAVKRVDELVDRFVPAGTRAEAVGALRYQLFTALAGTISEAQTAGAGNAVVLVHDFRTDQRPNAAALEHDGEMSAFSNTVFGKGTPLSKGNPWCAQVGVVADAPGVNLYLAHVITDLRAETVRAGLPSTDA